MSKQIFPGGDLQQRKQEAARKRAEEKMCKAHIKALDKQHARKEKQQQKAKDKEMAIKMGPMARLMIVRRGLESFLAGILLSIAAGSAHWVYQQWNAEPTDKISYPAAFKRAYDIRNLGDKDTAFYPFMMLLMLTGAAAYGRKSMRRGKEQAHKIIEAIEFYPSGNGWFYKYLNAAQGRDTTAPTPEDKMTAICRAIVAKYAAENRQSFDGLVNGTNTMQTRDYATTVAKAHLKRHPKDFNMLKEAFFTNSLPKSLVKKYGEKQR